MAWEDFKLVKREIPLSQLKTSTRVRIFLLKAFPLFLFGWAISLVMVKDFRVSDTIKIYLPLAVGLLLTCIPTKYVVSRSGANMANGNPMQTKSSKGAERFAIIFFFSAILIIIAGFIYAHYKIK